MAATRLLALGVDAPSSSVVTFDTGLELRWLGVSGRPFQRQGAASVGLTVVPTVYVLQGVPRWAS